MFIPAGDKQNHTLLSTDQYWVFENIFLPDSDARAIGKLSSLSLVKSLSLSLRQFFYKKTIQNLK